MGNEGDLLYRKKFTHTGINRSCLSCQMRKAVPDKPAGFIELIEIDCSFNKIGIKYDVNVRGFRSQKLG